MPGQRPLLPQRPAHEASSWLPPVDNVPRARQFSWLHLPRLPFLQRRRGEAVGHSSERLPSGTRTTCLLSSAGFRRWRGRKKRPAIRVGITALPMTVVTSAEYCPLINDAVAETVQRRNRAEGQPGGHHERIVPPLLQLLPEARNDREEAKDLRKNLGEEQQKKSSRRRYQRRDGHKGTCPDEIKRCEEPRVSVRRRRSHWCSALANSARTIPTT